MIRSWHIGVLSGVCSLAAAATLFFAEGTPTALAQTTEPAGFTNVKIWVNPEYDDLLKLERPSLLVMMEGEIAGAQPPVTVRFLVPTTAVMYSAGSKNAFGEYKGGPPNRKASSVPGYDEISYQLAENTFRVEYYDPIGQLGVAQKSFSYDFLRFYPVQDLSVKVQQPKTSDNFTVSPAGSPSTDNEGFNVQTYAFTGLDVSTPVRFDISYIRGIWEPSIPTPPANISSPSRAGSNIGIIVAVAAVVAALGGGGVYLMSRNGRKSRPMGRAERRRRGTLARREVGLNISSPAFCSQCGHKLDRPSRFCPDCGAEIG